MSWLTNDKERGAGEHTREQKKKRVTDEIVVHRLMTHGGFGLFATLFRETLVPFPALP